MSTHLTTRLCWLPLLLCLSSCQKYQVSVNDRVVYTPPGVFKDYQIADTHLADCVTQTIYDLHATSPEQVTQLNCSNAGIKSLTGLEKFYALKALNLANNQLTDISDLGKLGQLRTLVLNNNSIKDASPLLHLLHLQDLQLEDNAQLDCKVLKQLENNLQPLGTKIHLPAQCSG